MFSITLLIWTDTCSGAICKYRDAGGDTARHQLRRSVPAGMKSKQYDWVYMVRILLQPFEDMRKLAQIA